MSKHVQTNSTVAVFSETALKELAAAARTIKYGQILITVHNGRIAQIDKTEKYRFDASADYDKGSGI
jgi:hypothetical protein